MGRIALTDGTGRWFDASKARRWEENTRWDGHNHVSLVASGSHAHETLYRTAGGIYVLRQWSQWQGSVETVEELDAADAAIWLSRNGDEPEGAGPDVVDAYAALELQ
jgi:hypothetical protein